jgi:hypothetical protein
MQTPVDDSFRSDATRLRFRFRCEDCAHFEPDSGRCAEGFPNESHRATDLRQIDSLLFCKSFELG